MRSQLVGGRPRSLRDQGGTGRRPRRSRRCLSATFDRLEERTLLSVVPVYRTYSESDWGGDLPGGGTPSPIDLEAVPLLESSPMRLTRLTGDLNGIDPGDVFRITLEADQILSLRAQSAWESAFPVELWLADAEGHVLARGAGPASPLAGDPATLSLTYTIPAGGNYLVGLAGVERPPGPVSFAYVLDARPIGLNRAAIAEPGTATLAPTAVADGPAADRGEGPGYQVAAQGTGITGFLSGGRLNLVGPTGYGFQVAGNWTQIATPVAPGMTSLTFVASAGIGIVTRWGTVPMPLPPGGSIVLTTLPNGNGGAFGVIDKTRIFTGLAWLDILGASLRNHFGATYVLPNNSGSIEFQQGFDIGLALGSTIMSGIDVNAPLNGDVPYFYVIFASGAAASFGNMSISAGAGGGQTKITAFVDPADPFIYFGLSTPAVVPVLSSLGVGASYNGRIPFTPDPKPLLYQGSFSGHVYAQLELNIPAYEAINVNVNGKTVINVDALGDGRLRDYLLAHPEVVAGGAWAVGQLGAAFGADPTLFHELAVGANAAIGVNVVLPNVLNATFKLGKASAVYTGTASPQLYFRGEATNNLLSGTLLEPYMQFAQTVQTFVVDGKAAPGTFVATYETSYSFFGSSATLATTVVGAGLNAPGATLTATITGKATLLGVVNASVTGVINQNGTFRIDGDADVTIAGFTLSQGRFRITNQGILIWGDLDLGALGTVSVASAATTDGNFILVGTFQTDWGIAFAPKVQATATLSKVGLKAETTVAFLGQQASLQGSIQPNLDVSLRGEIFVGFTVLGQSIGSKVGVFLARAGGVSSLGGNFKLQFSGLGLKFSLVMQVFLSFAGIGIPLYSGGGTASITGPLGTTTGSVDVTNNSMVIDLPLIPVVTIPLPF